MDKPKRPSVGVGVIIIKDKKVLMGRRKNANGKGTWSFPGGHFEFNEDVEDCARREVMEETGIKIKNLRKGPYINDIFGKEDKHYLTLYIIADYDSGEREVMDSDSLELLGWFDWDKLPRPLFFPCENLLKQGKSPFDL